VKTKLTILLGALCFVACLSYGQGTVYFSRSVFEAALSSSITITFEDLPPTDWQGAPLSSVTTSGVTFTGPWARLYITNPNGLFYPIPGSGKYLWQFDGGYPVSILLPGGVTAFGADFSGGIEPNLSFNATLTVNLAGGGAYAYNFSADRGTWAFFGITFPEPIANLVYDDGGVPFSGTHEEKLDNVTFGSVIPEPAGAALLALGTAALLWHARKWRGT
jgi:hypothetical protein